MKKTLQLRPGEAFQVGDATATVIKCGMHSQGGAPSVPFVTVEVDEPETAEDDEDAKSTENETVENTSTETDNQSD